MSQQDENNINYSNRAVYNSQSSVKDYSVLKTPQNRLSQAFLQSQQFLFSEFKHVEDDPQYITPAKIEDSQFNKDVSKCYAPRKVNPDTVYDKMQKRIRPDMDEPRQYPGYFGGF